MAIPLHLYPKMYSKSLVVLVLSAIELAYAQTGLQNSLTSLGISAIFPADSGYATARQAFNQRFDVKPATVVFPTTAAQVASAVKAGSDNNVKISARSGGHSYAANGLGGIDGAMVIDLSKLKKITVNSTTNTATIETGNRLGDVALALNKAGRAIPHGTCAFVGIGGHAGHGGFAFVSRAWGLTLDVVVSANVVLANGTTATASATQNSELFWGLRGSASSFGIITSFTVKTFPAPASATIFTYEYDMSVATATKAVQSLQSFAATNVSSLWGAEFNIGKGSSSGRVSLELSGGWYGAAADFTKTIQPLLSLLPKPSSSKITPGTWIQSVQLLAGDQNLNTTGATETRDTFYAKSLMTPAASPISATALTAFFTYLGKQGFSSSTEWFVQFELYGGSNSAVNAVAADATAFAHRNSLFTIQMYASSSNFAPPYPAAGLTFVDGMVAALVNNSPSGWDYGAYLNYIDDRLTNWQNLYYGSHYARLETLKRAVDPRNLLSFPKSVELQ